MTGVSAVQCILNVFIFVEKKKNRREEWTKEGEKGNRTE